MTASGVLIPVGRAEAEGHLGRFFVVAPGSAVVSTVAHSRSLEASLTELASNLQAAEERLAALAPQTRRDEQHLRELREMRRLVTAIMTDAVTPPRPAPGSAPASLRSWPE